MKVKIIRIGNSMGIRIPKVLLDQYGLKEDAHLEPEAGGLMLRPTRKPREGWDAAFRTMAAQGDDRMLDQPSPTRFDEGEWSWE